jgi:type VI secretion system protein ImpH
MDVKLGAEADALSFLAALAAEPYEYDFYQTLRRLECMNRDKPRWGEALRPADELVRLGQDPDVSFAPAPLASFDQGVNGRPGRLQVRLFGLLGPNGPLPIHITEFARTQLNLTPSDRTLSRFLDLLHHRFLALFYRAWAEAQPHVNRDRPGQDRYMVYVGAFVGVSPTTFRDRDSVPDLARLFHVGTLVRQVRNAEGLRAILQHFFRVAVRIEQFVGHWLHLGPRERTYLQRDGAGLGSGAVLGARDWDHQCKFRIHNGPLSLADYESFLPAARSLGGRIRQPGTRLKMLVDWLRFYLCFELDWDVRLHLKQDQVPRMTLGALGQLGWTTWLGTRSSAADADDLCLNGEFIVERDRVA